MLYDFNYIERKRNGYRANQVFNSTKPSTYLENYRFPRQARIGFRGALIAMCVVFVSLYLLLDLGAFDPIFDLFLK